MQPLLWQPSIELSAQEEQIVKRIRKAKLFVFLRQHRHELFDEAFQKELASLYRKAERDHPPVAPAVLALALILFRSGLLASITSLLWLPKSRFRPLGCRVARIETNRVVLVMAINNIKHQMGPCKSARPHLVFYITIPGRSSWKTRCGGDRGDRPTRLRAGD